MPPSEDKPDAMLAFMTLLEAMEDVLNATDGYKSKCLARGYSETVSELMAAEFHSMLVRSMNQ